MQKPLKFNNMNFKSKDQKITIMIGGRDVGGGGEPIPSEISIS